MHNSLSLKLKAISAAAMLMAASTGLAYNNSVTYTKGQGLVADGFGGYDLITERCGIANGADADGPYILWVLTASGAKKADITGPWGTAQMIKSGNGTFKYVSGWFDPIGLPGNIVATYDGKAKNAQLVVSHGCRPITTPGWCSPGFWRNARDGAWALTGKSKSELFNTSVHNVWYGASFAADPTLAAVLGDAPTYSGPPLAGTSGYALNAFNATGAYLTNNIPGVTFNWNTMTAGGSDACPIDSFGNFK
jgi:hypothetical protein